MPQKKDNTWASAVKIWNKKNKNLYCIPKKGTPEFKEVKAIQKRLKKKIKA